METRSPHDPGKNPRPPQKMPKARAQALANKFKRGLAISSIMGFGAFSGLVALHQVSSTPVKATVASSQNSKSIVKKQGGNNFAASTPTPTPTTSKASKKSTSTPTVTKKVSKKSVIAPTATNVPATPVSGTSTS